MIDRPRIWAYRRWFLVAASIPACLVAGYLAFGPADLADRWGFSGVFLSGGRYLRDVSEPIAMVKGSFTGGSDDHWIGVTFRDAKGVEREAKFVYHWPPFGGHPGYRDVFVLGDGEPAGKGEERALLGLLRRWYRQDEEARALRARVERRDPTLGQTPFGWDGLDDPQEGKVVAAQMMKILEGRNGSRTDR